MSFQLMSTTETQATDLLGQQGETNASDIQAVQFTPVNDYTTFRAEFAIDEDDLVFHFFLPPEIFEEAKKRVEYPVKLRDLEARVKQYWLENFPRVLDVVARRFFRAEAPRLQATYVDDYQLKSWWLRAYGFASEGLSPELRCQRFLEELDQSLDALKVNVRLV